MECSEGDGTLLACDGTLESSGDVPLEPFIGLLWRGAYPVDESPLAILESQRHRGLPDLFAVVYRLEDRRTGEITGSAHKIMIQAMIQ